MAAKDGPALFELMRKKRPTEGDTAETPTPDVASQPCEPPLADSPGAPEGQPAAAKANKSPSEPIPLLELVGEHLRVSLTSVTAAVALGLLLILLAVAYEVGHRAGRETGFGEGQTSFEARTASEIEAARSRPPEPELLSGLEPTPATESAAETHGTPMLTDAHGAPFVRVPGDTYVVVQEFRTDGWEDARHAQEFLRLREVNTALIAGPAGTCRLLSTQGYNYRDPAQKEQGQELLKRIHAIGREYRSAGGRYGLEGYPMTYTGPDG